jgi:hypothetical protein
VQVVLQLHMDPLHMLRLAEEVDRVLLNGPTVVQEVPSVHRVRLPDGVATETIMLLDGRIV